MGHVGNPTVSADDGIRRRLGFGEIQGHNIPTTVLAALFDAGLTTVNFLVVDGLERSRLHLVHQFVKVMADSDFASDAPERMAERRGPTDVLDVRARVRPIAPGVIFLHKLVKTTPRPVRAVDRVLFSVQHSRRIDHVTHSRQDLLCEVHDRFVVSNTSTELIHQRGKYALSRI